MSDLTIKQDMHDLTIYNDLVTNLITLKDNCCEKKKQFSPIWLLFIPIKREKV